jgi:dipeptidyl-peptidase-4
MTIQMMLRRPQFFKVGVAGGSVINWELYEVMYGERYMDTPLENPDGYKLTNLTNYSGALQGRLLVIQGAQDPVVVWQHSLSFIESCIKSQKQVDYFVYPNHEHNVKGIDREHLSTMISEFFIRNL